jgi:hypothetical protein
MEYVWLLIIIALALLYVCAGLYVKETFNDFIENQGYPTNLLCAHSLTSVPEVSGPADTTLENPREPYHLLGDYLKPATSDGERIANLTSECAYVADGQKLIEKTGTYCQVTNNYKRAKPDNGTTWLHELSLSFYK